MKETPSDPSVLYKCVIQIEINIRTVKRHIDFDFQPTSGHISRDEFFNKTTKTQRLLTHFKMLIQIFAGVGKDAYVSQLAMKNKGQCYKQRGCSQSQVTKTGEEANREATWPPCN